VDGMALTSVTPRSPERWSRSGNARNLTVLLGAVTAAGFGFIVAGYWAAIALRVNTGDGSYGCGSPFLGRWFSDDYDPMARAAVLCGQAAPGRRALTFAFGGIGLVLLVGIMTFVMVRRRRRALGNGCGLSDIAELSKNIDGPRHSIGLGLVGVAAAVLLLTLAGLAMIHGMSEGAELALHSLALIR
jgi:hypothetical protein